LGGGGGGGGGTMCTVILHNGMQSPVPRSSTYSQFTPTIPQLLHSSCISLRYMDHVYNTVEYIVPRIMTYAHDLVLSSPEPHGICATYSYTHTKR